MRVGIGVEWKTPAAPDLRGTVPSTIVRRARLRCVGVSEALLQFEVTGTPRLFSLHFAYCQLWEAARAHVGVSEARQPEDPPE
jgi:hypothetical protein